MHTHNPTTKIEGSLVGSDAYSANTHWDINANKLVPLHRHELVIPNYDVKNYFERMNNKLSKTPTKQEYERALETVQKYEDRQKDLAKLNRDLGFALKKFDQIKFDVNENKGEITFTGVTKDGHLKLTKSVSRYGDKFEEVIGKLICVKKALGEDIKWIDKFVEHESTLTFHTGGITVGDFGTSTGKGVTFRGY